MITEEKLRSLDENGLQELSDLLTASGIEQLVEWLFLKDDAIRYPSFLLLRYRSACYRDVYPYWDVFCGKLTSENSYQRNIGLRLIADNVRWDETNKIEGVIDSYLSILHDEKPITVRQCAQSLAEIARRKPALDRRITDELVAYDILAMKETMRKGVLLDILNVLCIIRKRLHADEIEVFIEKALSGDVLDKKAKKEMEAFLQS